VGGFRADRAEAATRRLLARSPRPTALVVANNTMAVGTLRAVRETGLRVPDDVAIATVDDPVWAELVEPPLTALAQPVRAMAEVAVRLVLERVSGERNELVRVVLPMELRLRRSSGRPASDDGAKGEEQRRHPGAQRPQEGRRVDGRAGAR
jgi:DNA-binding LacI/PurR family transcriptional regulator